MRLFGRTQPFFKICSGERCVIRVSPSISNVFFTVPM